MSGAGGPKGQGPGAPESGAQVWDPDRYARNAGFVAELGAPVVELLAPLAGERILDLGCGDGALTEKLAALGVEVVGVDASAEQVEAARARGLDARVMRGQALDFEAESFDAVFSNAALHWMKPPGPVIAGIWRLLRPGGRFVAEMGGAGNVGRVQAAMHAALAARAIDAASRDPWFFPTPEDYRGRLEAAGFNLRMIELIPRPTKLPGDIGAWLETFAEDYLAAVEPGARDGLIAELAENLAPGLSDGAGNWTVDYVRLRFAADKPAG